MSVSKRLRFKVLRRDKYMCVYCGARAPIARLEIDHRVPRCNGGPDTMENLVAACFACNRGKGPLDEESDEWSETQILEAQGYTSWEDKIEQENPYPATNICDLDSPDFMRSKRGPKQHFSRNFNCIADAEGIPVGRRDWSMSPVKVLALAEAFDYAEAL